MPRRPTSAPLRASLALGLAAACATPLGAPVTAQAVVAPTATPVTATVDAGTTLNVRTGPSTSTSIVGRLGGGTSVTGTVAGDWMHITAGKFAGRYTSAKHLTRVGAGLVTAWTMSNAQAAPVIRSGPSFAAPAVGRAGFHQRLTGTLVGDWLKIGARAYVNRGTLETTTARVTTLNGRMPSATLCPIPLAYNTQHDVRPAYTPKTPRYINCFALNGLNALQAAYKARFGTYAAIDLGYRPYAEQVYWYKTLGAPIAAYPGTSNHGYGIAIDFQEDARPNTFSWGHPGKVWLEQNAGRYGWNCNFAYGTPHESYHHNFIG